MRLLALSLFCCICASLFVGCSATDGVGDGPGAFEPMIQDGTLAGWSVGVDGGGDGRSLGADGVFTVVQHPEYGEVIHVYAGAAQGSDQPMAVLASDVAYGSFVFEIDYCWLENRFGNRSDADRDAGVLFHLPDGPLRVWPSCIECQIGESGVGGPYVSGDLWVIGKDTRVQNERVGDRHTPTADGSNLTTVGGRGYDKSLTQTAAADPALRVWNTVRVVVDGGRKAVFFVNGQKVNEVVMMERQIEGAWRPLTTGRVGVQAELGEMLYRNPRIRPLHRTDLAP